MDSRLIVAALSLLLVVLAPDHVELAGEPGDASAEIAVSRTVSQAVSRLIPDVPASGPLGIASHAPAPAFDCAVEAPATFRSTCVPSPGSDDRVHGARPPPAA